eukprot:192945_1
MSTKKLGKKQNKNKYKDDYVKPYKKTKINDLTVKQLKELLRKEHFPVSGAKAKLIGRLVNPKQTIYEMKYSYHRTTHNSSNCGVRSNGSIPLTQIHQMIDKQMQFDPKQYIFQNGKIITKRTLEYGYPKGKSFS